MNAIPSFGRRAFAALSFAAFATEAAAQESARPPVQDTAEQSIVFRIRPTGDPQEERRMLETLARYLRPRLVAASAGTSIFDLIRQECGTAKAVHLEMFRRLNPDLRGTVLSDSSTVALPPCPYWNTDAYTVIPPGGSVVSEVQLATGVSGDKTLADVESRNPHLAPYRDEFDRESERLVGESLKLPYAVLPTTFELNEQYAGTADRARAEIALVPGAVAVELDNGNTDLVRDVRPAGVFDDDCVAPQPNQPWPFSATDLLSALRHNDQVRERLGIEPRGTEPILVGVGDTGIELEENRLPLFMSPVERRGRADFDDDRNRFVDDVFGARMWGRRGPPELDHQYERRGHGTSVAGLVVGGLGSPELTQEVASRINLSIISLVERETQTFPGDTVQRSTFRYPEGNIAQALTYKPYNRPLSIINLSIQSPNEMENFRTSLRSSSVLVVAAAGNDRENLDRRQRYPAYYVRENRRNMITVAAHNALTPEQLLSLRTGYGTPLGFDVLPRFTNRGYETVDLAAPGCKVASIDLHGTRGTFTGSSYAAPLVSFTAALLMSEGITSGERVKNRIMASVDMVPRLPVYSNGILNIRKALAVFEDVVELRDGELLRGRIKTAEDIFPFNDDEYAWGEVLKVVPWDTTSGSHPIVRVFLLGPDEELVMTEGPTPLTEIEFVDWATGITRTIRLSDILDLIPASPEFRSSDIPQ